MFSEDMSVVDRTTGNSQENFHENKYNEYLDELLSFLSRKSIAF
jgi:hypothetical protein